MVKVLPSPAIGGCVKNLCCNRVLAKMQQPLISSLANSYVGSSVQLIVVIRSYVPCETFEAILTPAII